MDIDFGDAWDFVDDDGKPYRLRFGRNWAPQNDPRILDGTGQLIAVVPDANRLDNTAKSPSAGLTCCKLTSNESSRAGNSGPLSSTPAPTA
jgi:hypothetical protein